MADLHKDLSRTSSNPPSSAATSSAPSSSSKLFYLALFLSNLLVLHLLSTRPWTTTRTTLLSTTTTTTLPAIPSPSAPANVPNFALSSPIRTEDDAVALVQRNVHALVYIPSIKLLAITMAKAGTRSLWHLIYNGLVNKYWKVKECGIIHLIRSPCWSSLAIPIEDLTPSQQFNVLTSTDVLRIAVQREPFNRLISAYKNKFSCNRERFNAIPINSSDPNNMLHNQVHSVRRSARLPKGGECMNVSEFAYTLDVFRRNAGTKGYPPDIWKIDVHVRPQQYHFDRIDYGLVLNTKDLSNVSLVKPILDRLPHQDAAKKNLHVSSSGSQRIWMDEIAAERLHTFAGLSRYGPVKYML